MSPPGETLHPTPPEGDDSAMTTTPTAYRRDVPADGPAVHGLVEAVRPVIAMRADSAHTATLVTDQLRAHLPDVDVLTPGQREGRAGGPAGHLLHAASRIHDHITWYVAGVLQGVEHEDLYDDALRPIGTRENHIGEVSGFAPPGDIHRIGNTGTRNAASLHIYGTDITRIGSSARRYYS